MNSGRQPRRRQIRPPRVLAGSRSAEAAARYGAGSFGSCWVRGQRRCHARHGAGAVAAIGMVACVALALGGCASWSRSPGSRPERTLAPVSAAPPRTFEQILTIRLGEQRHRFIAAGRICGEQLLITLLTPQGLEIGRLEMENERVALKGGRNLPAQVSPTAIVADFQLAHWPSEALRTAWSSAWRLQERPHERRVLYRGRDWVRVHYEDGPWSGIVRLVHQRLDYTLKIRTRRSRTIDPQGQTSACPSTDDKER